MAAGKFLRFPLNVAGLRRKQQPVNCARAAPFPAPFRMVQQAAPFGYGRQLLVGGFFGNESHTPIRMLDGLRAPSDSTLKGEEFFRRNARQRRIISRPCHVLAAP